MKRGDVTGSIDFIQFPPSVFRAAITGDLLVAALVFVAMIDRGLAGEMNLSEAPRKIGLICNLSRVSGLFLYSTMEMWKPR